MDRVPFLSMIFMAISCVVGFAIPVILFIYFRKKKHADISPFFVGFTIFMGMVMTWEASIHRAVFGSTFGVNLKNNIMLYALYGGLMAAAFEEIGRLIAFGFILRKKYRDKNINACMYGAGHGGLEATVILGFTMISNLLLSFTINSGNISDVLGRLSGDNLVQFEASIKTLIMSPSYIFLLGILERVFTVIIQISLSVLVWFAVKRRKSLFVIAFLLHFAVDAMSIIMAGIHMPAILIELILGIEAALIAVFVRKIYVLES